jgi:hypothetical protein
MKAAIVRWMFYLAALLAFGPIAAMLVGNLRAANGGPDATPLVSTAPVMGVIMALGAMVIALLLGIAASRLVGAFAGMSTAGLVVAWIAWRTGTVEGIVRSAHSGRPLYLLAVEGIIFGIVGIGMAVLIVRMGDIRERRGGLDQKAIVSDTRSWTALGWSVLAGAAGAGILAVTALKGQAIAGAILGGVLVGVVGRLQRVRSVPAYMVPIAILAILGPLSGIAVAGGVGNVVAALYRGTLFPVAHPVPLDWIAGGLLGIPIGIGWAGSMERKAG